MAIARLAEELGFDSIWAGEHVVVPSPRVAPSPMEPTDPILDPLVHLAFVAARAHRRPPRRHAGHLEHARPGVVPRAVRRPRRRRRPTLAR